MSVDKKSFGFLFGFSNALCTESNESFEIESKAYAVDGSQIPPLKKK